MNLGIEDEFTEFKESLAHLDKGNMFIYKSGGSTMRILTNISKGELDYLSSQPTAKAMIEKVKTEGIYIPEGDAQGAAAFTQMRNSQKQAASLDISDEGMAALKQSIEPQEDDSQKEQIKKQITELKNELAKIKSKQANSQKAKEAQDKKANAIMQQISVLSMQLVQLEKTESDSTV